MGKNGLANLSFTLPNGVVIAAYNVSENDWEAIDVCAEFPNGSSEVICSVDYEKEEDKLRVFVHDRETDDPVYEQLDYFGLSKAAADLIKSRIADINLQLRTGEFESPYKVQALIDERFGLVDTLRLAGIPKEEIPV